MWHLGDETHKKPDCIQLYKEIITHSAVLLLCIIDTKPQYRHIRL